MAVTTPERYVVASCHVERPLDDETWHAFSELQRRRPGGLVVAALIRPPDHDAGERDDVWLERAAEAAARGPLGHHTHWTSPSHARPTGNEAPGERVRRESVWLREHGITAGHFCGGGWYTDAEVAAACAEAGYVDCTPRATRPAYLAPAERWAELAVPAQIELEGGRLLHAVPTTHSAGDALRAALRLTLPATLHVYFHDTDLVDARRRRIVVTALRILGHRGPVTDLDELAEAKPGRLSDDVERRRPRRHRLSFRGADRGAPDAAGGERYAFFDAPEPSSEPTGDVRGDAQGDVRRSRVYLLSRGPWTTVVRRVVGVAILAALDVVGLAIGVYVALVIRSALFEDTVYWSLLWDRGPREWLPFLAPITILVFFQVGLYAPRELRAGPGKVLSGLVLVALTVLVFGLGTGYEFKTTGLIPTAVITSAISIGAFRAAYASVSLEVLKVIGVRRRVLLLGESERLANLRAQLLASRGGIGIEIIGAVARTEIPGLPLLGHELSDLPALFERERPDELVLSEADFDERAVLEVVHLAHRFGVKVKLAPSTTELLVHEGEYVPGQGLPLFELRPPILSGFDWVAKRAFDLVVAALVIVIGLPLWLLLSAAVKLDSRGPVLYRDRRVGVGEQEFGMLKFRTMTADAAARQDELEQRNEASGALFKIRDDPRVTRVGAVLRRFSLDELPQLVNVLRGEMSLVGPRPLPLRDHALLEDWHRARYHVLPGMTGLWQISGRSGLEFDDLVRLDFTYIENWSIWSDISIIAKTIPAVIAQRGAY